MKTVLIVDNDQSMRDLIGKVVAQMGYRTVVAERATRARSLIAAEKVDAMLLDLNMPGPQGEHLLHCLRRLHVAPPTIVVSGYLNRERIGTLAHLGVCGIIAKPFEVKRLMDELRRVLEGEDKARLLFCSQCGTPTHVDDHSCRQCGYSLEHKLACPRCKIPCDPGDRFCSGCGFLFAEATAVPAPQAEQASRLTGR